MNSMEKEETGENPLLVSGTNNIVVSSFVYSSKEPRNVVTEGVFSKGEAFSGVLS